MNKIILHCDMNNYFASVESINHQQYKTVPMVVCPNPKTRHGIILAKNDIAKSLGIITGESLQSAMRKCPDLTVVNPDYPKYLLYAKKIRNIFKDYSDKVIPYGLDEAWIDLSYLNTSFAQAKNIANTIRNRIKNELGFTCSIGVSFNYVFAKLGSDYKKPNATTVIEQKNYKDILYKLPVCDMLFVGKSTLKKLFNVGIVSIGDLATVKKEHLIMLLGKNGGVLWEFANGIDDNFNPIIQRDDEIKSIGNTITPPKDLKSLEDVKGLMYLLSSSVSLRLKKHHLKSCTICVNIKDNKFNTISRRITIKNHIDNISSIYSESIKLFLDNYDFTNNVRSLGICCENLSNDTAEQLTLNTLNANDISIDPQILTYVAKLKVGLGNIQFEETATSNDREISLAVVS